MTTARGATFCFLLAFAGSSVARTPDDMERPFDQYSWVTAHNAFTSNGLVPNQTQTIATQLAHGVRGLMLDLHYSQGRVRLCHKVCTGHDSVTFADLLNETLLPFLDSNPDAIVSLHLEDETTPAQLIAELARAPRIAARTFNPYTWDTRAWPTYRQLRDSGQRLLIFSLNEQNTGDVQAGSGTAHIMASVEYTVENYWSLGTTALQHDNRCVSRWSGAEHGLARLDRWQTGLAPAIHDEPLPRGGVSAPCRYR